MLREFYTSLWSFILTKIFLTCMFLFKFQVKFTKYMGHKKVVILEVFLVDVLSQKYNYTRSGQKTFFTKMLGKQTQKNLGGQKKRHMMPNPLVELFILLKLGIMFSPHSLFQ